MINWLSALLTDALHGMLYQCMHIMKGVTKYGLGEVRHEKWDNFIRCRHMECCVHP